MKLVAFDLDGTLINTLPDITDALNSALRTVNCPPITRARAAWLLGHGARRLCYGALPEDRKGLFDTFYPLYLARYHASCCVNSHPYPGIPELLAELKHAGIQLAVLSNKPHADTDLIIRTIFGDTLFDAVCGGTDGVPLKPDPAGLELLLSRFGRRADETVFVGDSDVDIDFARNASVRCVSVSWGFRPRAFLMQSGAESIADTADDLRRLLLPD